MQSKRTGSPFKWIKKYIVGRESKPHNSDFYQNNFLSTREYQTHGTHSVIILVALDQKEPQKSINHASKYMKYTIILVLILPRYDVLP